MSRDLSHHRIIKNLDNSPRMLFWEIDEFALMVAPFFIGLAIGSVFLMGSGFFLRIAYARIKRKMPKGVIQYTIYWILPKSILEHFGLIKRLPGSHLRELVL